MTYADAKILGYHGGYTRMQRGYVSRKNFDVDEAEVQYTKDGRMYVLCPCYCSTRYCIRLYLVK